jgi:hypothetical protein
MEHHDQAADDLEQQADRMEEASQDLKRDIDEQREDWDSKGKSERAPGAQPVPEPGAEPPPDREAAADTEDDGDEVEVEETENRP